MNPLGKLFISKLNHIRYQPKLVWNVWCTMYIVQMYIVQYRYTYVHWLDKRNSTLKLELWYKYSTVGWNYNLISWLVEIIELKKGLLFDCIEREGDLKDTHHNTQHAELKFDLS